MLAHVRTVIRRILIATACGCLTLATIGCSPYSIVETPRASSEMPTGTIESGVASDVASYLDALRSGDAAGAASHFQGHFDLARELGNAFGPGVLVTTVSSSDVTVTVEYGPHPPPFVATATVSVDAGESTRTIVVRVRGTAAYETLIDSAQRVR